LKRDKPDALSVSDTAAHTWSMDFMAEQLANGRVIRTLNVLDDFNRECLGLEVNLQQRLAQHRHRRDHTRSET